MTRIMLIALVAASAGLAAQEPAIQNGRVVTRAATSLDRDLVAVGAGPDPVWAAWRTPMVDGDPNVCSSWSDGRLSTRGEVLEPRLTSARAPESAAPGPARLEAGTEVVVLARLVEGRIERLRAVGDDCPIDAGGRTVYWLTGVAPADSVRHLDGLTRATALNVASTRRLAEAALAAIALHKDAAATAVLDRLSGPDADRALRRQAAGALARTRGLHGFERVTSLLAAERDASMRQSLVTALGDSPVPSATAVLLDLARRDGAATVRAEAVYRYIGRAGQAGLPDALAILNTDADDQVRRRVVSSLAMLPPAVGTPVLIDLARSSPHLVVRKEAVSALGRSKDALAMTALEEFIR